MSETATCVIKFTQTHGMYTQSFSHIGNFRLSFQGLIRRRLCRLLICHDGGMQDFGSSNEPRISFIFRLPLRIRDRTITATCSQIILHLGISCTDFISLMTNLTFTKDSFSPLP